MKSSLRLSILLALTSCAPLAATPVTSIPLPGGFLNVDYFAGTGPETAYVVVDFGGAPGGGQTHAFGFHFSGNETAADALAALAPGGLSVSTSDFGGPGQPNLFIDGIIYNGESDTPNFSVDSRFWDYFLGSYAPQSVTWTESANFGISGRDFTTGDVVQFLTDGEFVGFYASSGGIAPGLPVAAAAATPEPSTLLLAVLSGAAALVALRRSKRSVAG